MKKTIKILMMSASTTDNFTSFYDDFFEQVGNKLDITIEYEAVSWYHAVDVISQKLKSDNPPDLFQLGTTWISGYASMGFLDEVPKSSPKYEPLADWIEDLCLFEGKKVCLPWIADTLMLFANREHMTHMNIQGKEINTTEGLLETCDRILKAHSSDPFYENRLPLALLIRPQHDTMNLLLPWLRSFGWDIDEVKYPLFSPANKSGLHDFCNYLKRLMKAARLDRNIMTRPSYAIDNEFFLDNKFTFSITRWWKLILDLYRQRDIDSRYSFTHKAFPIPTGPSGSSPPFAGGSVLCVPSNARHRVEAWAVAAELMTSEHYSNRSKMTGDTPAIDRGFWRDFEGHPRATPLYAQIQSAKHYPTSPIWLPAERVISNSIFSLVWNYIYEDKSFDQLYNTIMVNADKRLQSISDYYWR
ncbi:MAG TPA: extracellular solute-binding protein [Bacillota bacterium]|nr:extracellular solute-binding protein [Bacillota bacterium]